MYRLPMRHLCGQSSLRTLPLKVPYQFQYQFELYQLEIRLPCPQLAALAVGHCSLHIQSGGPVA
jgi:hypothetical protein